MRERLEAAKRGSRKEEGRYDQSITSSATRAPHTAPILPGTITRFARYTFAAARARLMRVYKPASPLPPPSSLPLLRNRTLLASSFSISLVCLVSEDRSSRRKRIQGGEEREEDVS